LTETKNESNGMNERPKDGLIERWGAKAAALTTILTLVFLVLPQLRPKDADSQTSKSGVSAAEAIVPAIRIEDLPKDHLVGRWRQYDVDGLGNTRYLSTVLVSKHDHDYIMAIAGVAADPDVGSSRGVFDVRYDGTTWTFNSDWGNGQIGMFILRDVAPDVFEGQVYLNGAVVGRSRWTRAE
jgi:hypothetical protein